MCVVPYDKRAHACTISRLFKNHYAYTEPHLLLDFAAIFRAATPGEIFHLENSASIPTNDGRMMTTTNAVRELTTSVGRILYRIAGWEFLNFKMDAP